MKKVLLLFLFIPLLSNAQKFILTQKGFVDSANPKNDYIIINVPNKTKEELYKISLLYLSKQYVSPKDVLTRIQDESIAANFYERRAVFLRTGTWDEDFDMHSTVNYDFKDGKIRIRFIINEFSSISGNSLKERRTAYFFNRKGERRDEESINTVEKHVNSLISKFVKGISEDGNW